MGPKRGLSTFDNLAQVLEGRTHAIDLNLLRKPLRGLPDGSGHVSIAPVDESGSIDDEKLRDWASYRKSGRRHPFTQIVLDARVEEDVPRG